MPEILILGNGYLGGRYAAFFGDQALLCSVDITDSSALEALLAEQRPRVVINAAAKTNTAAAEDPKNQLLIDAVNIAGPLGLIKLAGQYGFRLVHLSTGMMYDGGPYVESDRPNALSSYYAETKVKAEEALAPYLEKTHSLILRLHMPFSSESHPRNLLLKLPKFQSFVDEPVTMTRVEDLLAVTAKLLESDCFGVYNVVNPGPMSILEVAQIMQRQGLLPANQVLQGITRDSLETEAVRKGWAIPSYPILSVSKLEAVGIRLQTMQRAIEECVIALSSEAI